MVEFSDDMGARSRANESMLLRALAGKTQAHIAAVLGISEATVSRMAGDDSMAKTAKFLAAAGLKVVPEDAQVYEGGYIDSLRTLASRCIELEVKGANL